MLRLITLLALFVAGAAFGGTSEPGSQCYTGYAYHPETGQLAYTARYTPEDLGADQPKHWQVIYRDAGNNILATKSLDFSHKSFVPVYRQQFRKSQNMAGIERDTDGSWRMLKRDGADGELESETFDLTSDMVADNGIHPFIQANFERLMANEPLNFQMVLAARQRLVDMRLDRIEDTTVNGEPVVRFRAKVDMLFVSWFTQEITFTYAPEHKRLLSYRGVSTMQDQRGKPFPVEVRYFRGDAPQSLPAMPECGSAVANVTEAG